MPTRLLDLARARFEIPSPKRYLELFFPAHTSFQERVTFTGCCAKQPLGSQYNFPSVCWSRACLLRVNDRFSKKRKLKRTEHVSHLRGRVGAASNGQSVVPRYHPQHHVVVIKFHLVACQRNLNRLRRPGIERHALERQQTARKRQTHTQRTHTHAQWTYVCTAETRSRVLNRCGCGCLRLVWVKVLKKCANETILSQRNRSDRFHGRTNFMIGSSQ